MLLHVQIILESLLKLEYLCAIVAMFLLVEALPTYPHVKVSSVPNVMDTNGLSITMTFSKKIGGSGLIP